MFAITGQKLLDDIVVKGLPCTSTDRPDNSCSNPVVYTALLAQIEVLEAENKKLKFNSVRLNTVRKLLGWKISKTMMDSSGFTSFRIFEAFYEFLGPATQHLNY